MYIYYIYNRICLYVIYINNQSSGKKLEKWPLFKKSSKKHRKRIEQDEKEAGKAQEKKNKIKNKYYKDVNQVGKK